MYFIVYLSNCLTSVNILCFDYEEKTVKLNVHLATVPSTSYFIFIFKRRYYLFCNRQNHPKKTSHERCHAVAFFMAYFSEV